MIYEQLGSSISVAIELIEALIAAEEAQEAETEAAKSSAKAETDLIIASSLHEESVDMQNETSDLRQQINAKQGTESIQLIMTLGAIGVVVVAGGFLLLKK